MTTNSNPDCASPRSPRDLLANTCESLDQLIESRYKEIHKGLEFSTEHLTPNFVTTCEKEINHHWYSTDTQLKLRLDLALIYTVLAELCIEHEYHDLAIRHIAEARQHVGWIECHNHMKWKSEEAIEVAKKGGISRSKLRTKPMQERALQLLETEKPASGWMSQKVAIRYLSDHKDMIKGCEDGLSKQENLPKTIRGWLRSADFKEKFFKHINAQNQASPSS